MRIRSVLAHAVQAVAEGSLLALLIVGLVAGTTLAARGGTTGGGKGGGGGGSTIAVAMTTDANGNGSPNWGDQVRFTVTTSEPYPIVTLACSAGGTVVGSDSKPYYWPNAWDDPGDFTLSSQAWTGGPADCRADLKGQSRKGTVVLASTSFHVDG